MIQWDGTIVRWSYADEEDLEETRAFDRRSSQRVRRPSLQPQRLINPLFFH